MIGKVDYFNLVAPLADKIKEALIESDIASFYSELDESKVPSAQLFKQLQDIVDAIGVGLTIKGAVAEFSQLPVPSAGNNGDIYLVSGTLYISNGTEWIDNGSLRGPKGDTGAPGMDGRNGYDGAPGAKGDKGDKGDPGQTGLKGDKGDQGIQGEKGDTGISAYELAVENGFVGTVSNFLASLRGAKGDKGDKGDDGERGLQGIQGVQGIQGEPGIQGLQGIQGLKGDTGDSFTIAKSYPTVAALLADQTNPDIPNGSFVIISSGDPDNDPDNGRIYIKEGNEYIFQSIIRGLKGEKGDDGPQGVPGQQGNQGAPGNTGAPGEKGDKGDKGDSVRMLGSFPLVSELPDTDVNNGDLAFVGTVLYTYNTEDSAWEILADLQGLPGQPGLKGDKGDKGDPGQGVTDIGTATLLTQAQTLRESINEVFQSGNNVKANTVNALLSKDPNLPITVSSSWSSIVDAINTLMLGYKVNGGNISNGRALGAWSEGDFLMSVASGIGNEFALGGFFRDTDPVRRIDSTILPDGRVLVAYSRGNQNNDYLMPWVALLDKVGDNIEILANIQVDTLVGIAFKPSIIMLNSTDAVVCFSSSTTTSPVYRTVLKRIRVSGNNLQLSEYTIIDNTANSSFQTSMKKLDDNRFLLARHSNTSDTASVSVITHNPSSNTIGQIFTQTSNLLTTTGTYDNLHTVKTHENKYLLVGSGGGSASTLYYLASRELLFNPITGQISWVDTIPYYAGNGIMGNNLTVIETKDTDGQNIALCLARNSQDSNKLIVVKIKTNESGGNPQYTRYLLNVLNNTAPSTTTPNHRNSIHALFDLGGNNYGLVYDSLGNTTRLTFAIFDLKTAIDGTHLNILQEVTPLNSGTQTKSRPTMLDFGEKGFGLVKANFNSINSTWLASAVLGTGGWVKYVPGTPATNIGIALSNAVRGQANLRIRQN